MKIIINAFQYASVITGTDRMAHNFLVELQKLDASNQYIVICSDQSYNRSVIGSENFRVVAPANITGGQLMRRIYNKLWRTVLPYRLWLMKADRYVSFHNMSLPSFPVAKKMIAFNLDLIPLVIPGYESIHKKSKDQLLKDYKRVAELADGFVSISEFSKQELCQELDVKPEKVSVVYLAADENLSLDSQKTSLVDGKYVFTIGGSEPRKNVTTVIDAYLALPEKLQEEYKLVVAGGKWHNKTLDTKDDTNIIELGYVPDEQLPVLYTNATTFVFASEYEGFGFTILEAMASGTPVINARGSSLDEVSGNATLTFDPKDTNELSQKLSELLSNETLQKELVQKGYEQNKKFSWEKSARQLHKILTEI